MGELRTADFAVCITVGYMTLTDAVSNNQESPAVANIVILFVILLIRARKQVE